MKYWKYILILLFAVAINIPLQWVVLRLDLSADHRFTLSRETRQEIRNLDETLEVCLCLDGALNSGFQQLRKAALDLTRELNAINRRVVMVEADGEQITKQLEQSGYAPIVVHERSQDGKTAQTMVYPYAILRYRGKQMVVNLLQQNRGKSGEENLNHSIETLEYAFMEAIHTLRKDQIDHIAFLEGHGELDEESVYDWTLALSRHFQVDRGVLGCDAEVLKEFKAVIIADPQLSFSDTDKYILDQYLMQGGRLMWLVNGVKFSSSMLSDNGVTPVVAQDLNLKDMFFRYGVRINPALVQDMQCLNVPVDVSRDPQNPQYQPIPWTYAPLLLTSEESSITRGVMQVSSTFISCLDAVGGEDGIRKEVLLATSSASGLTGTPAEVDLSDLSIQQERFQYQYLPVAVSLEGSFPSVFAHRIAPDGVMNGRKYKQSEPTRQVVVASGNLARNEWYQGQPLPVGYDRYSRMQFGNRDFLVNAILWLTDDGNLIRLRQKSIILRLLNNKKAHRYSANIQIISILVPVLLLGLTGGLVWWRRKKQYAS